VRAWLRGIGERDLLGSYEGLEGVRAALGRMERRSRRPVALVPAIRVLEREYQSFEADFTDFFPDLVKACASGHFLCNIA
jgi:acyl carrier protein phosphodiesterase